MATINLILLGIIAFFSLVWGLFTMVEKKKLSKHINKNDVYLVEIEVYIIDERYSEENKSEIIKRYFFAKNPEEAEKLARGTINPKLYIRTVGIEFLPVHLLKREGFMVL